MQVGTVGAVRKSHQGGRFARNLGAHPNMWCDHLLVGVIANGAVCYSLNHAPCRHEKDILLMALCRATLAAEAIS